MHQLIQDAISQQLLIKFHYRDEDRMVEPHTAGMQKNGSEAFCGWQVDGGSGYNFRLYLYSEISNLELTNDHFDGPRSGYRQGDSRFSQIYAEL